MSKRDSRKRDAAALLGLTAALGGLAACTLLGAGIGAAADPGEGNRTVPGFQTYRVPIGKTVTVNTRAGDSVTGTFQGAATDPTGAPRPEFIVIESGGLRRAIAIDEIDSVEIKGRAGNGWLVGGAIGLAVDAAILLAISSNQHSEPSRQPDTSEGGGGGIGSCPLVYSFDGAGVHLDAELFSGVLFPSAQRTDWATLAHAADAGGKIRLELMGHEGETQHIDEIRLVVADHPRGTEVFATATGTLLALPPLEPPRRARGFFGADLRPALKDADGRFWTSNPFGRDPRRPAELRDHVELDFARPTGARRATLVLRVLNTVWGSLMQRQMLIAQGRGIDEFYQQMESSAEARRAVRDAMVREGMLQVQIQKNGAWQSVDHVWEVGPAVARDVAIPLDLSDVSGDTVRVRLDSTVGLWSIDRAGLSFAAPARVETTEVEPERAMDGSGRDRTAELATIDRRHFVMRPDEHCALEFRAPAPRAGMRRTAVAKGTGWYEIEVSRAHQGHPELARRFVTEPGFFGRVVLEQLRAQAREALR